MLMVSCFSIFLVIEVFVFTGSKSGLCAGFVLVHVCAGWGGFLLDQPVRGVEKETEYPQRDIMGNDGHFHSCGSMGYGNGLAWLVCGLYPAHPLYGVHGDDGGHGKVFAFAAAGICHLYAHGDCIRSGGMDIAADPCDQVHSAGAGLRGLLWCGIGGPGDFPVGAVP